MIRRTIAPLAGAFLVASTCLVGAAGAQNAATPPAAEAGPVYEFLKATEDRVWRLNRQTGEIAVCTLEREALVCSTSAGGAETPATSYEELQQRRAAEAAAREAEEVRERKRAFEFLDRMIELFREYAEEPPPDIK